MFRSNIIGVPIFNLILWLGRPEVVSVFKNSGVKTSKASFPSPSKVSTESELKYSFSSPLGNFLKFYYYKSMLVHINI